MAASQLVLDASYTLEAILPSSEKWRSEAVEVIEAIAAGEVEARVPWIFFAELAYVATSRMRGRQLDAAAALGFLRRIDSLGLRVEAGDQRSVALHMSAIAWHAGAYDAIYLELARRSAAPIATRDRGMTSAARVRGVALFKAEAIKRP